MKLSKQKLPKLKKGAWFVRVRGSYLPRTWQGWLMHILLVMAAIATFITIDDADGNIMRIVISGIVYLYAIGSFFTYIASRKS